MAGPENVFTSSTPSESAYTYVVGTFGSGELNLYQNGRGVDSNTSTAKISPTGTFEIGAKQGGQFERFEGDIDELAVYAHVLSSERVQVHWAAAQP
jgi:Concanavalin A-like lectin/glucanases superfamily